MRSKHDWDALLTEWASSDMSRKRFCDSKGLSYQSFLYHFKKKESTRFNSGFRQISIADAHSSDRVDYYFADGRRISFPLITPRELIRFLLSL